MTRYVETVIARENQRKRFHKYCRLPVSIDTRENILKQVGVKRLKGANLDYEPG